MDPAEVRRDEDAAVLVTAAEAASGDVAKAAIPIIAAADMDKSDWLETSAKEESSLLCGISIAPCLSAPQCAFIEVVWKVCWRRGELPR